MEKGGLCTLTGTESLYKKKKKMKEQKQKPVGVQLNTLLTRLAELRHALVQVTAEQTQATTASRAAEMTS